MTTTLEQTSKWAEAYKKKRPEDYDTFIRVAGMNHDGALEGICHLVAADRNAPIKVLELGTGTGLLTHKLMTRFPNSRVDGIDGSSEMLALAQKRLAPVADRFHGICSSFEAFPWASTEEGSYDLVMSSFALHHMAHSTYRGFFSQVRKILKPGGQLLVADLIRSESDKVQNLHMNVWVNHQVRQMKEMLGITKTWEECWRDHIKAMQEEGDNPAPLPDLLRWLSEAGFTQVDSHWRYFCAAIYGGVK